MKTDHYLGFNLQLLAKYKSLQWDKVLRLEEVQTNLGVSLEEMLLIIEDALHPEPYSPEEVCRCLGISLRELQTQILSPNTQNGECAGESKNMGCSPTHSWEVYNFFKGVADFEACLRDLGNIIYILGFVKFIFSLINRHLLVCCVPGILVKQR